MQIKFDSENEINEKITDPRDICNIIEGEEIPQELLEDIEEPGVLKIALNLKKTTFNMRS